MADRLPRVKGSRDHDWPDWKDTPLGRGRVCKVCGHEDDGYQFPCNDKESDNG